MNRLPPKEWSVPRAKKKRERDRKYWSQRDPCRIMLCRVKCRAKIEGSPFNLTIDDIVIPNFCPVLGIPLERRNGKPGPNSPSLDRIQPELGYTRGNVVVISHKANSIKSNATPEELTMVARWARTVYPQWLLTD